MEIDVNQKGDVISPLLFGHNLEVTRRSVFGGLSAEMVSNRKFAALDNGVPKRWCPIDSSTNMAMDDEVSYASRASLRVIDSGSGGIRQQVDAPLFTKGSWKESPLFDDYGSDVGGVLAFNKDRKYTFRWQLKTDAIVKDIWMRITDTSGTQIIGEAQMTLQAGDWQTWTGEFVASETVDNARLEIGSEIAGSFWIGAASLQPSDAFHRMRRDVIELLREIKCSSLRYPGGCYSDYYKWREGLLPVDERPVISEGPLEFLQTDSDGYDTQEIAIDDFIALCRELNCEPALTVRMWNVPGEPEEAVAWVEYCNGSADTQWGKVRAERGHPKPYNVEIWFVGNELYSFGRNGLKEPAIFASCSRLFAEAMKNADPSIELVGCNDSTKDGYDEWSQGLMEQAGEYITYGSYHCYSGERVEILNAATMAKASVPLGDACQTLSKNINRKVMLDEWNMLWGRKSTVPMALHVATTLNMLCRDSRELGISHAYYFQPVNEGAIIVTPLEAKLDLAGIVFKLFGVHQGSHLLEISGQQTDSDLDICASLAPDEKTVFVTAINRNCDKELPLSLSLSNFTSTFKAEITTLLPHSLETTETKMTVYTEELRIEASNVVEVMMPPGAIARIVFTGQ